MEEKKVISIEDRIPKLKEARKKKTNRRLVFYLSLFFILISIVVYLQSPLSYIQHIVVNGNEYVAEDVIVELSELSTDNNLWSVSLDDTAAIIKEHPELKDVQVQRELPNSIVITVEELKKVAYIKMEDSYRPLLENGEVIESIDASKWQGDAPLLIDFTKETYIKEIAEELQQLPVTVADLISEIYWKPTEANPYKVLLFMDDGYQVESSIRNFATYLQTYPSIVSQLEEKAGIIRIGEGGAVFDPYNETDEEEEAENETEG
ncbi:MULTISPECIES: cell division protein FtsQ/DivIB [Paraliobacillus]|uniref:cell division protein FtsQ/DivIB n=1 Tax=Paraliobacillus TaxID=200903 RepID=UPI000DD460F3|nr:MULTISPECIES: FtsQ-type POTRA domain-containing protein [Paraliobacillus]